MREGGSYYLRNLRTHLKMENLRTGGGDNYFKKSPTRRVPHKEERKEGGKHSSSPSDRFLSRAPKGPRGQEILGTKKTGLLLNLSILRCKKSPRKRNIISSHLFYRGSRREKTGGSLTLLTKKGIRVDKEKKSRKQEGKP